VSRFYVAFVAKGRSDLQKWLDIGKRISARLPNVRILILTSFEVNGAGDSTADVVNIYEGLQESAARFAKDPKSLVCAVRGQLPMATPDAYKADERYLHRCESDVVLAGEQVIIAENVREVVSKYAPRFLFCAGAGTLIRTVAFGVAKSLGVGAYRILGAHHMNPNRKGRRYFFCDNDGGELPDGEALFRHDDRALESHVARFLMAIESKEYRLDSYARSAGRAWRVSGSTAEAVRDAGRLIWCYWKRDRLSVAKLRTRLGYYRRSIGQAKTRIRADELSTPYVLLPLNVPNDAQLRLRAKEWSDTEALVRLVASNMPSWVELVVKPHPGNPGMLGRSFMKRIRREYPHVRFVSADEPLLSMLDRALAAIVVNSSVALESGLRGIPCFHLGRSYMAGFPNCVRIESFDGFSSRVALATRIPAESCKSGIIDVLRTYYGFTFPLITEPMAAESSIEETIADGIVEVVS